MRYLVENSLGRLWMLNHPDSQLIEQMDYYIRPEEPETDFLRISSPEEIRICDPACGSGHMLTYAFELLYAIYEEQGYQATEIPRLILENNLYGIEIDQRAGALAAFALVMKAREKYPRFLSSNKMVQPNICVLENIHIEPQEFGEYMDKVGRDLFTGGLQGVVHQFEEADNFGSLIRPLVTDVSEVLELLCERKMGEDLFLSKIHQKVLKALRQADYLSPKYHVVVANPPYMGSRGMNAQLKALANQHYPTTGSDLFAAFVERNLELCVAQGAVAMITMQSWIFLSSLEDLRRRIVDRCHLSSMLHLGPHAFDTIGGEVVSTAAFVVENSPSAERVGVYFRLIAGENEADKIAMLREALAAPESQIRFKKLATRFEQIPGAPLAYWAHEDIFGVFEKSVPLETIAKPRQGLATGENDRFVRAWHEVELSQIGFGLRSSSDAQKSGLKWFPYNKGGGFRKWYGNNEYVVNWYADGKAIREFVDDSGKQRSRPQNTDCYFKDSLTWSFISTTFFGVRYSDVGAIFDVAGSSAFPPRNKMTYCLALLCSRISSTLMGTMNPTVNFQVGNVASLPYMEIEPFDADGIHTIVDIAKRDWNSFETSWDFRCLPLIKERTGEQLSKSYDEVRDAWREQVVLNQELEERNNRFFIEGYGLSAAMDSAMPIEAITLECNPAFRYGSDKSELELEAHLLDDTMREFISYAVGCMLGRYSLDKPGLILANQGETADDYRQQIPEPTFAPDEDNVIPLLDGDWFTDDISERFKEFLKVTFGDEYYDENLRFLENSLYPDNGTARNRKTIRDYFLKEFYDHHVKMYKKRPIYWLFSSPKGTFAALIYMHRYRPDTVSSVLKYLRDFRDKLSHRTEHQQMVADSGGSSQTEKTKALKEVVALKKQLRELEEYEHDILYPLATKQVEIDLDDGVKHNYKLFGKALKKVTGLSAI